jgi:hypothetical protein
LFTYSTTKQVNGKYLILSGNHRIKAAIKAKQRRVLILFGLEADFDKNRSLALQLSHNAVVGQDDPIILQDIYSDIDDLLYKEYTGIVDEILQSIKPVELADLPQPEIPLHELRFVFCQADREYVQRVLAQLERYGINKQEDAVEVGDIDRFIDIIRLVKKHVNIQDHSIPTSPVQRKCADHFVEVEIRGGRGDFFSISGIFSEYLTEILSYVLSEIFAR